MKSDPSAESGRQLSAENLKTFSNLLAKAEHLPARQLEILDRVLKGEIEIGKSRIGSLTEYFDSYSRNLDEIARKCSGLNDVYLILDQTSAKSQERILEGFRAATEYAEQARALAKEAEDAARSAVNLTDTAKANVAFVAKETADAVKDLDAAARQAENLRDAAKKATDAKKSDDRKEDTSDKKSGSSGGGDGGDDKPKKSSSNKSSSTRPGKKADDPQDSSSAKAAKKSRVSKQDRRRLRGEEPYEDYNEEYGPTPEQIKRSEERVRENLIWLAQVVKDHQRDEDQRAAAALEEAKSREAELNAYKYEQAKNLTEKQKNLKKSLDKLFLLSHQDEVMRANRVASLRMSKWQDVADAGIEAQNLINQIEAELAFSGEGNFQEIVDTTPYPATPTDAGTAPINDGTSLDPVAYDKPVAAEEQSGALEAVPYDSDSQPPIIDTAPIVETTDRLVEHLDDLTEATKQATEARNADAASKTANVNVTVTADQSAHAVVQLDADNLVDAADTLGKKLDNLSSIASLVADALNKTDTSARTNQAIPDTLVQDIKTVSERVITEEDQTPPETEVIEKHIVVAGEDTQGSTGQATEASNTDHVSMFIDTTSGPTAVEGIASAIQKQLEEIDFTAGQTRPAEWIKAPAQDESAEQPAAPVESVVTIIEQKESPVAAAETTAAAITTDSDSNQSPNKIETTAAEPTAIKIEESIKLFMTLLSSTIDSSIHKLVMALNDRENTDDGENQPAESVDEISNALNGISEIQHTSEPKVLPGDEAVSATPIKDLGAVLDQKPQSPADITESEDTPNTEQTIKVIATVQKEEQESPKQTSSSAMLQPVDYTAPDAADSYVVDDITPRAPAAIDSVTTAEQTAAEIGEAQTLTTGAAVPEAESNAKGTATPNDLQYNEAGLIQAELRQNELKKKIATQYASQIEAYRARRQLELMRKNNGILSKEDATRIEKEIARKFSLEKAFDEKRIKARNALETQQSRKEQREQMMGDINDAFGKGKTFAERKEAFYNLTHDESGEKNTGKAVAAAILAVSSLAKQLEDKVDQIASKKSPIDTRLNGSNNKQHKGSYWDQLVKDMASVGAVSPYFKQEDFATSIETLVDKGIAFDLKQRAFLDTIHKKIATTFEVADGTLLRLIRIQQADSTAGRMGMEVAMNSFLNSTFETTEYLKDVADGVRGSLEEMQALMDGAEAAEVEFQAQKWLGSLYSVGMSQAAVDAIASAIGQVGAGQIEGITGGGAGNLVVMAANDAGLSIAELLTEGLDASETNQLLNASVRYLAELADSAKDNKVVQQQLANVFGVKASDLRAAQNLLADGTIDTVSSNNLQYDNMLYALSTMASTMHKRTSLAEMMTNLFSNVQYSLAGSMASNPASYFIYKMATVLDDVAGGIPLPDIGIMGNIVQFGTTISDLMRVGALAGGILGSLGDLYSGLTSSFSGRAMLTKMGIPLGSGLTVLQRGGGGTIAGTAGSGADGGSSTSESGYVGNSSGSDVKDATIAGAEADKEKQMVEAQEEEEANKIDFISANVLQIYAILNDVVNGDKAFRVKIDNYGLTKLGSSGNGSLSGIGQSSSGGGTSGSTLGNDDSTGGNGGFSSDVTRNNVSLGGWTN